MEPITSMTLASSRPPISTLAELDVEQLRQAVTMTSHSLRATVVDVSHSFSNFQSNINLLWVLIAAALVFFMQPGFMCLESGLARAKNSINVAIKNLADFVVSVILFWLVGFGMMFGVSKSGLIGTSHFMIHLEDPWVVAFFTFQAVFAGTAATIDSGAVAGRTRFKAYLVLSALTSGLIYPVFGHWAWGGLLLDQQGWLEARGFIDFAGSTVVHSVGGWMALLGIWLVGPRIGRFDENGKAVPIAPHNMTMAYLGTLILFFGWFGFNCGSTLEVSPDVAGIALNTMLAACFGSLASSALSWVTSPMRRPEGEMIANGMLAGLVGITAGCASVETTGAMWIGMGAGCVMFAGVKLLEKIRLDDVVGAVPVHGMCGAWGTIAVGFFITPEHLGDTPRMTQIGVQLLGVGTAFAWTMGVGFILVKGIGMFMGGLRVTREEELIGLNVAEHGASSSLLDLANAMHRATATGDFSELAKVEVEHGTEVGDLGQGFNQMVDAVRDALTQTRKQILAAEAAQQAAEEAKKQVEEGRLEHGRYIEETAGRLTSMISEMEAAMAEISRSANDVHGNVGDLQTQSAEITEATDLISNVAQTIRMLALNARVEAARAGEQGKSFAVVAQSMSDLSEKTREAADHIGGIVEAILAKLEDALRSVDVQGLSVQGGQKQLQEAGEVIRSLFSERQEQPATF